MYEKITNLKKKLQAMKKSRLQTVYNQIFKFKPFSKKAETGTDMVVCDVARKRLRWDYSRWSYPIGKDSVHVAILRDVGDGNVQRTEFRHVRENHRIISKERTVLAKTHAKGKRLRCGRPQSRQPDSDHKRKND